MGKTEGLIFTFVLFSRFDPPGMTLASLLGSYNLVVHLLSVSDQDKSTFFFKAKECFEFVFR